MLLCHLTNKEVSVMEDLNPGKFLLEGPKQHSKRLFVGFFPAFHFADLARLVGICAKILVAHQAACWVLMVDYSTP